jgi:hypothetical protein
MSEAQDALLARLTAEKPHGLRTRLTAEDPEDHPAAEWLTAYHADELPAAEAAELQAHLAICPICTQALLDLPRFYAEAEEPMLADLPVAPPIGSPLPRGARFLKDRRRVDAGPPPGTAERRLRIPPGLVAILAAGLVGCLVGFPIGIATRPKAPPPPAVAALSGEVTRGQESLDLAGISQTLVWPLPEGSPRSATYRVEIQSRTGATLLAAETAPTVLAALPGSGPAAPGTPRSLAVELPLEQLAPGDYRLVLIGLPAAERLDQRPLRIHAASPGV